MEIKTYIASSMHMITSMITVFIHMDLQGYHWTDVFALMAGDDVIYRYLQFHLHFDPKH